MNESMLTCTEPEASVYARDEGAGELWAIVLTGGEGRRRESPSPASAINETTDSCVARAEASTAVPLSLTLERVASLVPPRRIFVVTAACRPCRLDADARGLADVRLIAQPCDRGTAAGVLLPAHVIHARDPRGRVAVFAAEHAIAEDAVWRHVGAVTRFVAANPEWLVLLGAEPSGPDGHHGWIEPGERLGWAGAGSVDAVRTFWEQPPDDVARGLFRQGCLWPSFVFVVTVAALVETGLRCVPLLHDRLARLELFAGTRYEPWALRQAYEFAPTADFARAVLESPSVPLAVSRIPSDTAPAAASPHGACR